MGIGAALGIGGALVGGIAGAKGQTSRTSNLSGLNLGDASQLENFAQGQTLGGFQGLQGLIGLGPGGQDVTAGLGAQRGLGDLLAQLQQSGGLPGQQDIQAGQGIAQQLFAPQQEAQRQLFEQQGISAGRNAARLGRGSTDPVLRNLLAQSQGNQVAQLQANQAAQAQQIAFQLPQNRLGFASQRANLLGGLGNQALQNQGNILGIGSKLLGAERNFRIQTADKFSQGTQKSGGGFLGGLTGAIGGAAGGLGIGQQFGNLFGGGGGSFGLMGQAGAGGIQQSSGGFFPLAGAKTF